MTASVASSKLRIQAQANYTFDFLPAVLPGPTASHLAADQSSQPTISVSGIYTGTDNQTLNFTVLDSGSVGNGDLRIEVRNDADEVVTTLNVGAGYAAGTRIEVSDGIQVALGTGSLVAADTFAVDAFASTDTSGLWAALGINVFFTGGSAQTMQVHSDLTAHPGRIATAVGPELTDNTNVLRLARGSLTDGPT